MTGTTLAYWRKGSVERSILALTLALAACSPLPVELGRDQVVQQVQLRGRPAQIVIPELVPTLVAELSATPLNADRAMQIALINNPELRGYYAQLNIAAAERYRAGRIGNPIFSASLLSGEQTQNTYGLMASLSDLITLPTRKRLAAMEFATVQQEVGAELLHLAARAEGAFYRCIAAQQVSVMRGQIAKAADLSWQLARRYFEAGNLTPRDLALAEAAAAEAQVVALQAEETAFAARTELATMLGLSVGGIWDVHPQLSLPVLHEDSLQELLLLARENRLDLAAAIARTERLAEDLHYNDWRRWLGELDFGIGREREDDGANLTGPLLDWEIPIFTQHEDRLLELDAELQASIGLVARLLLESDNGVRLAFAKTQSARARVAVFRSRLIPARMEAVTQAQLEENYMLIGTFELLLSKQREYDAYQGYLEALGDYWVARASLAEAVGRRLPSSNQVSAGKVDVEAFISPRSTWKHGEHGKDSQEAPADGHKHHGMAP
ncbi:TolC family protein [Microbulbifer sp. CnH-101-G]|uniref:TolC family protein n=1 Tax=Microbulbifer sp. CnH-101-G TaxID=3243393 RepID=UPI0040397C0F